MNRTVKCFAFVSKFFVFCCGVEFESAKEATDFAAKIMKSLIGRNKSMLMKRLAKFERQGADRTIKVAKRAM
jgi:hypothetical protein